MRPGWFPAYDELTSDMTADTVVLHLKDGPHQPDGAETTDDPNRVTCVYCRQEMRRGS